MLVHHSLKAKEEYKNLKKQEIGDLRYIYQNELDRAYFQHDMSYGDLTRRTASDKVLCHKALNIAEIWWISTWTRFNGL